MNILNNKKISLIGIIFLGLFFTINTIPVSFGQECGITKNLVGESDTAFKARCEAISGCQITGSFCVAKITPPEVNVSGGGTVKSTDVEQCLTVLARSATKDEACKAGEEKFECKGDPNGWKCVPKAPPADITLYSTLQAIYETGTGFVSGLLSKSGRSEYKVIVDIPCDKAIVNIIGGASCAETKGYTDSLPLYITRLYQFGFGIVGVVALLMIIIGAAKYTLSAGSFTSKDEAREQITEAIYGILLLFGAYLILYTINPELVSIKAPTLTPVNVEKFLITPATPTAPNTNTPTSTAGQTIDYCKVAIQVATGDINPTTGNINSPVMKTVCRQCNEGFDPYGSPATKCICGTGRTISKDFTLCASCDTMKTDIINATIIDIAKDQRSAQILKYYPRSPQDCPTQYEDLMKNWEEIILIYP